MKVISLVSQKGGVGKSSLAVSLAVVAYEANHSVVVLDADRQGTAVQWAAVRKGAPPEVAAVAADKLEAVIGRLAASASAEVAFVDTAGIDGSEAAVAIRLSDLCLVPTRPSAADLRAVSPPWRRSSGSKSGSHSWSIRRTRAAFGSRIPSRALRSSVLRRAHGKRCRNP